MTLYNLTYVANSTDLLTFVQRTNTEFMQGFLGILLLIAIGCIMLMAFYWSSKDTKKSIAATMFLMFTLGFLFRAVDLINNLALFVIIFCTAAVFAFAWK